MASGRLRVESIHLRESRGHFFYLGVSVFDSLTSESMITEAVSNQSFSILKAPPNAKFLVGSRQCRSK